MTEHIAARAVDERVRIPAAAELQASKRICDDLKKIVADQLLDVDMLKELGKGIW